MIHTEAEDRCSFSRLVDLVRESWQYYKDEQHPTSGDYYYDQIISGVYLNQPIDVVLEHLPLDLRIKLEELTDFEVHQIVTRAIKEIFGYVQGYATMNKAEHEKRFHWRFVR